MSSTARSIYSFEIRDFFGRLVTILNNPLQRQFSLFRNRPGSAQFILDLYDSQATPDIIQNGVYDLVIRREGVPVYAGRITYHEPVVDGDKKQLQVNSTGYFDLLDYRMITNDYPGYDALHNKLPFASTDVGQVAWQLIDYAQFPVPNADDTTATTVTMDGRIGVQQSFVATGTSTVNQLRFILYNKTAAGSNMNVSIVEDAAGYPTGPTVANSSIQVPLSNLPTTMGWYEIDYPTNAKPALVNGTKYWIVLSIDTLQSGSNGVVLQVLNTNYYSNGYATSLQQPNLFSSDQDIQFFLLMDDNSYVQTKNTYLGFLKGYIAPSFNLTPVFDQYKHIKAAIEDLSTTFNGIDFSISVNIDSATNQMTRLFNTYYPRIGTNNTALQFLYPGNIKKIDKQKDSTSLANEVLMRGQGSGLAQVTTVVRNNASIELYGLRQLDQQEPDCSDIGTLQSFGDEILRIQQIVPEVFKITLDGNLSNAGNYPKLGQYGIGDQIQIVAKDSNAPFLDFTAQYRIEEIDVTLDDDDVEEIDITVSTA